MQKAWLNWSSGKDAAMALYYIRKKKEFKIEKLFTSLASNSEKVAMHEIPKALLIQKAASLGLELRMLQLPTEISVDSYNSRLKDEFNNFKEEGYFYSIYGDIFLEDLKVFREKQLQASGIKGVFPLWKMNTKALMNQFLDLGFKAIVVCVNSKLLGPEFCGRKINKQFLEDLPADVDPCGENGEYHSFVYDGPIFKYPVKFKKGRVWEKKYPSPDNTWDQKFWYCDLFKG